MRSERERLDGVVTQLQKENTEVIFQHFLIRFFVLLRMPNCLQLHSTLDEQFKLLEKKDAEFREELDAVVTLQQEREQLQTQVGFS